MTFKGKRAVIAGVVTACVLTLGGAATLAHRLLSYPTQSAPHPEIKEEPDIAGSSILVVLGCWEVTTQGAAVMARWSSQCTDVTAAPHGEVPWPEGVIRLPALGPGEPPMGRAQTHAVLSEELALEGEGALLFLPAKADGSGYYVAAWATETIPNHGSLDETLEPETVRKHGLVIGRYGAPPPSIATPAGRVYLSRDWTPLGLQKNWENRADVRYLPAEEDIEEDSAGEAPPLPQMGGEASGA